VFSYSSVLDNDVRIDAKNCSVVVAHTLIQCLTSEGAGTLLHWSLVLSGQRSTAPTTSYLPPKIHHLELVLPSNGSLSTLSTSGGAIVGLVGENFGPSSMYVLACGQGVGVGTLCTLLL